MDYQSAVLAYFSDTAPLQKLQDQLRKAGVTGEFTTPEDLHLTLVLAFANPAFVAQEMPRFFDVFSIVVDGIDQFLAADGRYAIYARVRHDGTLRDKHNWMTWNMQDEGVPIATHTQPSDYKPHITLCYSPAPIRPYDIDPLALLVNEIGVFNADQERVMSYFMKEQKGALARVIDGVKKLFSPDDSDHAVGSVFKTLGNGYWLASYTNDFEDRDKEILTRAAHDRYIARLENGLVPYPELWLKHIHGTRHGEALVVKRLGHIVFAAGKFDDTPAGRSAEKYYSQRGKHFENSHGFYFPPWAKTADGHYEDYNTFEISVLERGKAVPANQYTEFVPFEEVGTMPLSEQDKKHLVEVFGEDVAARMVATAEAKERNAEKIAASGAKFKVFTDATPEVPQVASKTADVSAKALSILLEAQEDLGERQDIVEKGLEGAAVIIQKQKDDQEQAFKAFTDKLEAQLKEFRELAETVSGLLNQTPKRIDETPAVNDPAAAGKAQDQTTVEKSAFDSAYLPEQG